MRDDPSVITLVSRVGLGEQEAWNELVERYSPLVWSICARCRLSREDADDVGQSVWLLLVEKIGSLREPAALPGWLATTTRRECLRMAEGRRQDPGGLRPGDLLTPDPAQPAIEQELIMAERHAALRAALAELQRGCHELLSMLISDPPHSYAEISATLGIPPGSIGPTRARCLDRLRRSPHLTAFLDDRANDIEVKEAGG
jgi:RNA polymerase sigma factor (sigma-70 family)